MNELNFLNRQFSRFLLDSILEQALDATREEELEDFEDKFELDEAEA